MSANIRRIDYFYTTVVDQPGESYKLLSALAESGVNLLAFTAVPVGLMRTQLCIFPEDNLKLADSAKRANIELEGPHPAIMVQGDDQLGVLAEIHQKLFNNGVNVYASHAIVSGDGSFGYVIYVKPEDIEQAEISLGI